MDEPKHLLRENGRVEEQTPPENIVERLSLTLVFHYRVESGECMMAKCGVGVTAAVIAWAVGVAQPATAATFIFDVSVTDREGGSGSFAPFTFRQAWSFVVPAGSGAITTEASGSGIYATVTRSGSLSQFGTAASTPVTKELMDIAGPIDSVNTTILADETFRQYLGFGFSTSQYDLTLGSLGQYYSNDGTNIVSTEYLMTLSVQDGAAQETAFRSLASFDATGLARIFAAGPLDFSESGERLAGTVRGGLSLQARTSYSGTATLRTFIPDELPAVPEPATWTMTILGFGVLGAGMRRRKKVRPLVTFV